MAATRILIVNADDFGLSHGINQGIITAHTKGIVTSASLMTRWPAAREAADLARRHPKLSVGLHLDLCEWVFDGNEWKERYSVVPLLDAHAVANEIRRQLDSFRSLLGRDPSHLDSHQHVHRTEPVRSALRKEGFRLGIPVRGEIPGIHYCGRFYGQSDKGESFPDFLTSDSLVGILRDLPEGITELCCHPSAAQDMDSAYAPERVIELDTLCATQVRDSLHNLDVMLRDFRSDEVRRILQKQGPRALSEVHRDL